MPTLADINLESLRPPGNPDDFVDLGYRPVFKQHTNRAGQFVGEHELQGITQRCNERIEDTGDFAALVIGHTSDDELPGTREVVGFVGPYRMSRIGNRRPLPAIEGKVWAYKDKAHRLRDYPRLSVEFWQKPEDPGDGYFDPICLLGDETPELDLGVHYSKDERTGRQLMRYRKVERFSAMAGGNNTFVPGLVGDDEKQQPYSKDSREMATTLTPADLQQIVAAIVPIVKQQVDEAVAGMKGETQPGSDGLGDELGDESLDGADGLDLENDPSLDVGEDLDGLDDDVRDDDIAFPPENDEQTNDDSDLDSLDDDEEEAELTDLGDENDDDSDIPATPEPSGEDEEEEPMATAAAPKKPDEKKKPEPFAKAPGEMTREDYAKENRMLHQRYQKAVTELAETKTELAAVKADVNSIKQDKVKAERYAKLNDLRISGVVLEVADELKDTADFTDEQFLRHCTKIVERYQRAPVGVGLPIPRSQNHDGVPRDEKAQKYAKAATDKTLELRGRGIQVEFPDVLANITANEGKYVPSA